MILLSKKEERYIALAIIQGLDPIQARNLTARLCQLPFAKRSMRRLHATVKNLTFMAMYGGELPRDPKHWTDDE